MYDAEEKFGSYELAIILILSKIVVISILFFSFRQLYITYVFAYVMTGLLVD